MSKQSPSRAPARLIKARPKAVPTLRRRTTLSAGSTHFEAHFKGPLPPPNILSQYDRVLPGLGNRIVAMTEREQEARIRSTEASDARKNALTDQACKDAAENSKMTRRGQTCGLLITAACIACAFICAIMGMSGLIVCAFIAVPTASFISSFMPSWHQRDEKDKP